MKHLKNIAGLPFSVKIPSDSRGLFCLCNIIFFSAARAMLNQQCSSSTDRSSYTTENTHTMCAIQFFAPHLFIPQTDSYQLATTRKINTKSTAIFCSISIRLMKTVSFSSKELKLNFTNMNSVLWKLFSYLSVSPHILI